MTVNIQKPIVFVNKCNCLVDEYILAKAILWYQDKPTQSNKRIYMHGRYPCVSIGKKKIHVHRLIAQYNLKRILNSSEHVHHKNHNRLDARISNLDVIDASDHCRHHRLGKKSSESTRKKIALAGQRRKGIKLPLKVNIPLNQLREMLLNGNSINKIAKHFECDWSTIRNRINRNPELLEDK